MRINGRQLNLTHLYKQITKNSKKSLSVKGVYAKIGILVLVNRWQARSIRVF